MTYRFTTFSAWLVDHIVFGLMMRQYSMVETSERRSCSPLDIQEAKTEKKKVLGSVPISLSRTHTTMTIDSN